MYTTVQSFEAEWKSVSKNTLKLFEALTDESLNQSVSGGHRTLGRIAWHIAMTLPEMAGQTGLDFAGFDHEQPVPQTAMEITGTYQKLAALVAERCMVDWTDVEMTEELELYGERFPRGVWGRSLIHHEIHHRGQMTILMRQAGLAVPGLYGPSKEEWSTFGMEEPVV
ncbi:MAG: DinB family protein [candidate division Zixibacteria bacterium]|nr:DinB family protein [candidate division Zixibacteria bacterium]MDH3937323.1 DinB family protein [candidate division Zixibacteria bacterium]MDH4033657.1 DinB family protein [candidate division Zixibacteria bacterium]